MSCVGVVAGTFSPDRGSVRIIGVTRDTNGAFFMAYDEILAQRIRERLESIPSYREVKMFGGLSFMLDGHIVAFASRNGGMMVCCPPEDEARLLAEARPARRRPRPSATATSRKEPGVDYRERRGAGPGGRIRPVAGSGGGLQPAAGLRIRVALWPGRQIPRGSVGASSRAGAAWGILQQSPLLVHPLMQNGDDTDLISPDCVQ